MKYFSLLNSLFKYVIYTSKKYNIDESHALKHSMDVYYYASKIYENVLPLNPILLSQLNIIHTSAILHDMCDKKYMNTEDSIKDIKDYLIDKLPEKEILVVENIISTMSYSIVKKNGFPELGEYQMAYHIVREADLLAAYDFDRCVIFQMMRNNDDYDTSIKLSLDLFENRILKYIDDGLFITNYGKLLSRNLHKSAYNKLTSIKKIDKFYSNK